MSTIDQKIETFFKEIETEENFLGFLYNQKNSEFNPNKDSIFYSGPFWTQEEARAAVKSLLFGKWLASGEEVVKFEKAFSKKYNFGASLMVNSGSSANLVMIQGIKEHLKWNDGDEVIVSPVGFPTTVAPLVQNNLTPVFVDINMSDLNFDLNEVEKKISTRTKAIFISPVLGNPPDMDALSTLATKHDILLILDGCDSLGSKWNGRDLGHYAYATSCSFYPAHHITTGEGGMVSANDPELIAKCRSIAWWGRDCYCVGTTNLSKVGACGKRFDKWMDHYNGMIDHKYLFTSIGYNLKPLDLQGSIGLVQLKKMDLIHQKRREHKQIITTLFKKYLSDTIHIPTESAQAETSWFGVPIICQQNKLKEVLVNFLEQNRIQTRNYFAGNLLAHPGYSHLDNFKNYPNANRVLDTVFFIGCHPSYTGEMFAYMEEKLSLFSNTYFSYKSENHLGV